MAKVGGYAIPGIVMLFIWIVLIALAIILLAFLVHWAGGGLLDLRLGHLLVEITVAMTCCHSANRAPASAAAGLGARPGQKKQPRAVSLRPRHLLGHRR